MSDPKMNDQVTNATELETLAINTIRIVGAEAVDKANSGHPGIVLGAAPMAYALWKNHMQYDPEDSAWDNRDRFVLSAGHGSMLIYMLLHLFTGEVTTEDIKEFRQWGGRTAGHPEYHMIPGIETTTGPLGQGLANAVGMAMAEAHLAAMLNTEEHKVVDHYTYVIAGDGCLMEGVTNEASSLAGTLELGKLIVLYDDNSITIDGSTDLAFREDAAARYEALGWQTIRVEDGNDVQAITDAISEAKAETSKPTLILVKTEIGFGSPKVGTAAVHGAALGAEALADTKKTLSWPADLEAFEIPAEVTEHYAELRQRKHEESLELRKVAEEWVQASPDKAELAKKIGPEHVAEVAELLKSEEAFWDYGEDSMATRKTSEKALNRLVDYLPGMFGGSADLAASNNTEMKGHGYFDAEELEGKNVHFGVREHAMAAAVNGIVLSGLQGYGATFFNFLDYMKPAVRLASIMGIPSLFIFTHDSIGLGEDGPTHQPIEQLATLRAQPQIEMWRPADGRETSAAYIAWLENNNQPTALAFTRQNLPQLDGTGLEALKGGYVISDREDYQAILMATGSEVHLTIEAQKKLDEAGVHVRVVSLPSFERFDAQDDEYKESVLPSACRARLGVEAGASQPWYRYTGTEGMVLGIDQYGASAPGERIFEEYGFTVDNIVRMVKDLLK